MIIKKLLPLIVFILFFGQLRAESIRFSSDSLLEVILQKKADQAPINVDFSAIFFDVESKFPNNIENANAYEKFILKGMQFYNEANYIAALDIFNQLADQEIFRTKDEEMLTNYYLGISFNRLGNTPLALYYLEKMIGDLENHPISKQKLHQLYSSYSSMLLNQDRVNESLAFFLKCLRISEELNDSLLLCRSLNNLGVIYRVKNEYDSALYYFNQVKKQEFKKHQQILHAFAFGNAASVLQMKGDTIASIPLLKKEIKLLSEANSNEGLFNSFMLLGNAFKSISEIDSANYFYSQAIKVADETKHRAGKVKAYEAILALKLKDKRFQSIYSYYNNYLNAKSEREKELLINNRKSIEQLGRIVSISRKSLMKKNEVKTVILEKQRLIYLIVSLCLVVLLLFVIIFYNARSRKKMQQKNEELAEKNDALKESYVTISKTNRQNELLLREVHHRVKNNLQMLISMFNLQKENLEDERMIAVFTQAQDRLQSIALVHQNIYQNNDFESIDLSEYIGRLIENLSLNTEKEVEINQQVDAIELSISKVIPIGLIICELITNSLKHAKSNQRVIQINLSARVKENTLVVAYNDNGILKDRSLNEKKENSIGITLIELFAEQLEAKLLFNHLEAIKGFHCRIEIPIN